MKFKFTSALVLLTLAVSGSALAAKKNKDKDKDRRSNASSKFEKDFEHRWGSDHKKNHRNLSKKAEACYEETQDRIKEEASLCIKNKSSSIKSYDDCSRTCGEDLCQKRDVLDSKSKCEDFSDSRDSKEGRSKALYGARARCHAGVNAACLRHSWLNNQKPDDANILDKFSNCSDENPDCNKEKCASQLNRGEESQVAKALKCARGQYDKNRPRPIDCDPIRGVCQGVDFDLNNDNCNVCSHLLDAEVLKRKFDACQKFSESNPSGFRHFVAAAKQTIQRSCAIQKPFGAPSGPNPDRRRNEDGGSAHQDGSPGQTDEAEVQDDSGNATGATGAQ